MSKLKMGLFGISIPQYIVRCSAIRSATEENVAIFPTPEPPLATIQTAIELLAARQQAVEQQSGKDATFLRDEAKDALHPLMVQLAAYVSNVAKGDGEIIISSGFDIVTSASSVGVLPPPQTIKRKVDGEAQGSIRLYWQGVERSSGYVTSIAAVADDGSMGEWSTYKAQRLSHTFTGLVSGQLYAMRVATLSAKAQGAWSIIVTYRPQ